MKSILDATIKSISPCLELVIDAVFPKNCVSCGAEGSYFCESCFLSIKRYDQKSCLFCASPSVQSAYCSICSRKVHADDILIPAYYDDPSVKKLVRAFKFSFVRQLSQPLGRLMAAKLSESGTISHALAVPVPLYPRRLRWRGFNQAEELAVQVACLVKMEINKDGLTRTKQGKAQSGLKQDMRSENIKGAFRWSGGQLNGKTIILVDDVVTTGSTLEECARILKSCGADKVIGLVAAKG